MPDGDALAGQDVGAVLARLRAQQGGTTGATGPAGGSQMASLGQPPAVPGLPPVDSAYAKTIIPQESGGQQTAAGGGPLEPKKFSGDQSDPPMGAAQIRPTSARDALAAIGQPLDLERLQTDKQYNLQVGSLYHDQMLKKYGNNAMLAAAAYNAGPGTVDGWIKQFGDPRTGAISNEDFAAKIPFPETRNYVYATGSTTGSAPPKEPSKPAFDMASIWDEIQKKQLGEQTEGDAHLRAAQEALAKLQEPAPQTQQTPPAEQWGSMAMAIAAIGGLLTHTPATAGLNAMAGVLDGFKANDTEKTKQELEKWKIAHEALMRTTEVELKGYEAAMRRADAAPREALALFAAYGAANGNKAITNAANSGDLSSPMLYATAQGRAYAAAMEKGDKFQADSEFRLKTVELAQKLAQAKPGTPEYDAVVEEMRAHQMEHATPGQILSATKPAAKSGYTQAALDKAARYFHDTHILPPGFGAQADKEAVMNREAELFPDKGEDAAEHVASYKSNTAALTMLTKQRDSAEAYERSTKKELDLAVSLIPSTPVPIDMQLLNRWARSGATEFGDVEVPKFTAALISALSEYSKVLSGGTGSVAASTDAARNEALSLIPPGATSDQIPELVGVLKQGMDFKLDSYSAEIQKIKQQLRGQEPDAAEKSAGGAGQAASGAAPVRINDDAEYETLPSGTTFMGPDGVPRRKP